MNLHSERFRQAQLVLAFAIGLLIGFCDTAYGQKQDHITLEGKYDATRIYYYPDRFDAPLGILHIQYKPKPWDTLFSMSQYREYEESIDRNFRALIRRYKMFALADWGGYSFEYNVDTVYIGWKKNGQTHVETVIREPKTFEGFIRYIRGKK